MTFEHNSKNKALLLIVAFLLVAAGVVALKWQYIIRPVIKDVSCTLEAKLCPDGTAVGRTGPNCEFATCPVATEVAGTEGWKPSPQSSISFKYPENLGTKYIDAFDWPPMARIVNEKFSCTEAGLETGRAGQTTKEAVNGNTYCITKESEGSAGSVYTQYAYAKEIPNNKTLILTFSLRYPQCPNYEDPQKTECENERNTFDLNSLVDKIFSTIKLP